MEPTSEETILASQGRRILFRAWLPDEKPDPVVVIAHGYGEHGGRYVHVAMRLNEAGYAVYVPDHHGHGRSDGPRGRISLDEATEDLAQIIELAAGRNNGCELFLLGHSMGGALALRYAMTRQDRLTGLVLIAPLVRVDGPPFAKAIVRTTARFAPGLPLKRIDPRIVSRDAAVVSDYADDPLVYHGGVPACTVVEFLEHTQTLPDGLPHIKVPTLLMYGTADRLVDPSGSAMVGRRISSLDRTVTPYEGLSHELLNEPEQQQVLDQIVDWVAARTHTRALVR
jgi:lysophospholipase